MNWKKLLMWTSFMGIGFLGGTLIGLNVFEKTPSPPPEKPSEVLAAAVPTLTPIPFKPSPPPTKEPEVETKYLLTLSDSTVCLYELVQGGSTVLLQEMEIDLTQLRKEDYENLCRGYTVNSLEEAKSLCEDFGS